MAFGKQPSKAPAQDNDGDQDDAASSKGQYDTATQTFRKPSAGKKAPPKGGKPGKAAPKAASSKGGFSGKTSSVRALSPQEHMQAAATLNQAGQHLAAAHHSSSAEQMQGSGPQGL